jgi:hypothetical protein
LQDRRFDTPTNEGGFVEQLLLATPWDGKRAHSRRDAYRLSTHEEAHQVTGINQ